MSHVVCLLLALCVGPCWGYRVGLQSILGNQWAPTLQDYVSNATGLTFQADTYTNDTTMVSDARAGQVQFTFAGPVQYLCLSLAGTTSDGIAELVSASQIDGQPVEKLAGAIVVPSASAIGSLRDLERKVILTGPISSLTTFAAQWSTVKAGGVDLFTGTRAIFLQPNITLILPDLLRGLGDAAFIPSSYIERYFPNQSYLFKVVNPQNTSFPYQHSTPLYPNAVVSSLDAIPFEVRRAVATALFAIRPTDPTAQAAAYYGFTSLGAYTQIRTLMSSLGLLDNNTQCRSIASLYDLVQCPIGMAKVPGDLAARCLRLDVVCPTGYQCVCSPCEVIVKLRVYAGLGLSSFVAVLIVCLVVGSVMALITARIVWLVTRPDPLDALCLERATVLGQSSLGPVLGTTWNGQAVAVKRLSRLAHEKTIFDVSNWQGACRRSKVWDALSGQRLMESAFLPTTTSRNIVRLERRMRLVNGNIMPIVGYSRGQFGREVVVVMPRMMAGTIADLLASQAHVLDLQSALSIASDVANAMNFYHSCSPQIVGKNIKPHHLFLDDSFRTIVGMSWRSPNTNSVWAPPECLRGDCGWTGAADVYSFSMLLYTLATARPPFEGKGDAEIIGVIRDADEETMADARPVLAPSSPLYGLITACWAQNPADRPTFAEIKKVLQAMRADRGPRGSFGSNRRDNNQLLQGMFPDHVRRLLESNLPVPTELFPCVTIFFSDIKDFTSIASVMQPAAVKNMLDKLYIFMDTKAEEHDIHKLETIGDGTAFSPLSSPLCFLWTCQFLCLCFLQPPLALHVPAVHAYQRCPRLPPVVLRDCQGQLGLRRLFHQVDNLHVSVAGFVAVTNVMKKQPDHAPRMAAFALDVLQGLSSIPINPDNPDGRTLELRVGLHSGEVAAGVVGVKNLRYCLFGHSINITSRMESSGEPGKIQMTAEAASLIRDTASLKHRVVRRPGSVDVKGQGKMYTYWLLTNAGLLERQAQLPTKRSNASVESV